MSLKKAKYKVGAFHRRKKEALAAWELREVTAALKRNDWDSKSTAKELDLKWDTFWLLLKKLGFTTRRGVVSK